MSREFDAMKALENETKVLIKNARWLFSTPPSTSTVRRYATKGVFNHMAGERIFLEAYREGWTMITSEEAVARFRARVNGAGT